MLAICNSHGDVVVGAKTGNAAPKEKLFELIIAAGVDQSLQPHVQTKSKYSKNDSYNESHVLPFLYVEALAVVFKHAQILIKL